MPIRYWRFLRILGAESAVQARKTAEFPCVCQGHHDFLRVRDGFICPQNAKKSPIFYRHSAHFCSVASPAIRQKASPNPGQGLILMTIKPGQSEKFSILALAISTR